MGLLLDRMLRYDAADADLKETVEMFRVLTVFPPQVFDVLPTHYRKDAERLRHSGLLPEDSHARRS